MRKKIAILGVGSAGILSICHFLNYIEDFEIVSIHDPKIPIVGIGESANPVFWHTIFQALGVSENDLFNSGELDATLKLGALYKNWRREHFVNPLFGIQEGRSIAIHFDTFKFKQFAFNILKEKYKNRFSEIEGTVLDIENNNDDIKVCVNEIYHTFDYVIDCRGFPKENLDTYTFLTMPLNSCLVHNIEGEYEYDEFPYTLHEATKDGWMFMVPLRKRKSYGYLYNSNITDKKTAKENFAKLIEIDVEKLESTEFNFKSYYTKKLINGRLMRCGNLAVFLEPMFANSLWLYDYCNRLIYDKIINNYSEEQLNYLFNIKVKSIHDLICYYYNGGSVYDTSFWNYAKSYSNMIMKNSLYIKTMDDAFTYMKEHNTQIEVNHFCPFSTDTIKKVDNFLGYNRWC